MSFFEKLIRDVQVEDPFAGLKAQLAADSAQYHAKCEPKIRAAVSFWSDNLSNLAENHANKLRTMDLLGGDVKQQQTQLAAKLNVARQILLQQSDANWSESVTDAALEELNHDAIDFRLNTKLKG